MNIVLIISLKGFKENAFKYACDFANRSESRLQLIIEKGLDQEELKGIIKKLTEKECQLPQNRMPDIIVAETDFIESALTVSENKETKLLVWGSSKPDNLEKFFGSRTTELIERTGCPLLIIPKEAKYKAIEKIVYCTNLEKPNINALGQVNEFRKTLEAKKTSILHVNLGNEPDLAEWDMKKLNVRIMGTGFSFETIEGLSAVEGISDYINEKGGDLIIMFRRRKGILDRILTKNHTFKMATLTTAPLLVLYEKNNEKWR